MTSWTRQALTVLAVIAASAAAVRAVQAQPAYPLVCRGGGNLHFTYTPYSVFSSEPQIWIRFERGTVPAGANKENVGSIAAGQCTWLDRVISPNEPSTLLLMAPVFAGRQFSIQWQQGQVVGVSSELGYLNVLLRADGVQTFRVSNDGRGNFVVGGIE